MRGINQLNSLLVYGLGYWGKYIWGGEEEDRLKNKIQNILFPELTYISKEEDPKTYRKWRNRMCDVLMMWTHIYYKRDIFITNDKHFLRKPKRTKLIEIGANSILTPRDALKYIKMKIKI